MAEQDIGNPAEPEKPENTAAASFDDVQMQVDTHFQGSWGTFLDRVQNPLDIMRFVLASGFNSDHHAFQDWASTNGIPNPLVLGAMEKPEMKDEGEKDGGIREGDVGFGG